MAPITTIVHFSVPKENYDEFLSNWHKTQELMLQAPGALSGVMHRCIDDGSPFQFVNVARWESTEALNNALQSAARGRLDEGVDVTDVLKRLGVTVSQNNYVEEVKY